jgi:hypothetical protein
MFGAPDFVMLERHLGTSAMMEEIIFLNLIPVCLEHNNYQAPSYIVRKKYEQKFVILFPDNSLVETMSLGRHSRKLMSLLLI